MKLEDLDLFRINEIKEIYNFFKHEIFVYITWYIAFTAVNYIALGWLSFFDEGKFSLKIFFIIFAFMIIQNLLAVFCGFYVKNRFASLNERIEAIIGSFDTLELKDHFSKIDHCIKGDQHQKIINLMIFGSGSLLIAWFFILFSY